MTKPDVWIVEARFGGTWHLACHHYFESQKEAENWAKREVGDDEPYHWHQVYRATRLLD